MLEKICEQCKLPFQIQRTGSSNRKKRFCNPHCSQLWQKENLIVNVPSGDCYCSKCKQTKPGSEFGMRNAKRRQTYCKKCLYLFQMVRWNSNKVKAINYLGSTCCRCKRTGLHPALFDFHHNGSQEKEFDWDKLRRKSWDKIKLELDKCDLLCCECHRMEHINHELWKFE